MYKPDISLKLFMACTEKEDYKRLLMHGLPLPGETLNTYNDRHGYEEGEETEKLFLVNG